MRKLLSSVFVFVFAFLTLFVTQVSAKVITNQVGDVNIAKNEIVNDDLFVAAKNVALDGTVNGDVYIGAESVRITGTINGNLHVGANSVILEGKVKGSSYIGSGNATLSKAQIGGSLLVGAGSVNIDKDTLISGSLLGGTGTITVNSSVKRNVFLGSGTALLNSQVGGEVRIGAGEITLGPSAKIAKDFYYATGREKSEINISETAAISGSIHKSEYRFADKDGITAMKKEVPSMFRAFGLISNIFSFLGALVVGFLSLKLFSKHFSQSAELVSKSFLKSLGVGFLVIVLAVPALLILAITGVGVPVAGIALLLLLLNIYLAKIVVGLAFGIWLSGRFNWKKTSLFATFSLGLFALYVLKMIPLIGGITSLVILWSGLGALTLKLFSAKA